ncbi:hypothetical protein QQS21_002057 [Conoideocrella luteorostrata]|uniref:Uncharacterized protein n=1 Tax=Conoideocrella luteorostrata TaxID=1105319 RepID=A0AAJ0CW21_9HYPO|nr:hypothetical protein QQS21_002057 [Conoideocrella luteorostrata]
MSSHNIVIAALPAGQEYGTGSAAALAIQVKKFLPDLWFGLPVGVAASLPRLPTQDIRLGDVLVGLSDGERSGLVAYDLGKETKDGFQRLRAGHGLAPTKTIVRAAIGSIKLDVPNNTERLLSYYENFCNIEHASGTLASPGQDHDELFLAHDNILEEVAVHPRVGIDWRGLILVH